MKNFTTTATVATIAAAGLSAAILGLAAPAAAAPSGDGDARATISQLEADGNRVIVNRQGSTALNDATVVSVRPGPEIREWVIVDGRQGDNRNKSDRVLETVGRTYFVDIQ